MNAANSGVASSDRMNAGLHLVLGNEHTTSTDCP